MRFITMNRINSVILLLLLTSCATWAQQNDFQQKIVVDAKRQQVDIKNQQVTFFGQVEVRQGSIKMAADELTVFGKGGKGTEVMIATGSPATFYQLLDNNRPIEAKANEIRYEVRSRTLTLSGHAELRQEETVVSGESIQYNIEKQQLMADGGQDPEGRVTTIFLPETIQSLEQKP